MQIRKKMMVLWLALSLALAELPGGTPPPCSYRSVLSHLKLTNKKELSSARPVVNWTTPTEVRLDLYLYAILEVVEKSQTFTPFIWTTLKWKNELISWNPEQFCGIKTVVIPREMLWLPDITIMERIQDHNKMFVMPYLQVAHTGTVSMGYDFRVVSTCEMDAYKFPFDTQSCDLTFCSILYKEREIKIISASNSSRLTRGSRKHLQSQGDWEFLNISVKEDWISLNNLRWDTVVYTINFRRRPMVIVLHLMLPLFFFLILDLCTFFISDFGGEKLSFKVTVLLAISVLLLILNEILPSSSGRTPLIAIYCIGTFAFLLLSLLEAILVRYLIEKDATAEKDLPDEETDVKEGLLEMLRGPDVSRSSERTKLHLLCLAVQELRMLRWSMRTHIAAGWGVVPPRFWTRVAKRINAAFFSLYVLAVIAMLVYLSLEWSG